jgi:predicted phosphodiesterase
MMVSDKRCTEVLKYAEEHGADEACKTFGLSPVTLNRYRVHMGQSAPMGKVLQELKEKYSDGELRSILKGHGIGEKDRPAVAVNFGGKTVKFWFATDLHIGSEVYQEAFLDSVIEEAAGFGAEFGVIAGDVTEGLSTRPGHVYELTHIGYAAQLKYAVEQLGKWQGKLYCIDGNHDRWYLKSNGAIIVEDICRQLPDAVFLGHDEGDIDVNGIKLRLFHGEDSSSYATSYRIQKLVESYTGGDKPNVLLVGHTHKQGYFFERHIHCVSGGALSTQSRWMRSKRMANHAGFWLIEMTVNGGDVSRFKVEWFPFYV